MEAGSPAAARLVTLFSRDSTYVESSGRIARSVTLEFRSAIYRCIHARMHTRVSGSREEALKGSRYYRHVRCKRVPVVEK